MKSFAASKRDGQRIRTGKRGRPRSHVSLPGNLVTPFDRQSVVFEDISAAGARVSGTNLPPVGEFVQLTIGGSKMFASVVWREGNECGLAFDHRMSDAEVAEFRQVAEEARKLGLSPDMIRARSDWNNGL
ncbi:PilZ domain-containing protein [Aurantiacibacter odishensis]|uniref:PilZ domain-containing protein n=1 Tax=Aurantiacibacter odishensis TaxID=1155476 RepID=UPI0013C4DF86|nr:PilZ domain-containing protein [Aurantiacibacter odishensis]